MMRSIVVAALGALFLTSGAQAADQPASHCKGVAQEACAALAGCVWREAVTAGQMAKSGKPYTRSVKAHCRKPFAPQAKTSSQS